MTDLHRIAAPEGLKEMNEGFLEQLRLGTLPFEMPVLTVPAAAAAVPGRRR